MALAVSLQAQGDYLEDVWVLHHGPEVEFVLLPILDESHEHPTGPLSHLSLLGDEATLEVAEQHCHLVGVEGDQLFYLLSPLVEMLQHLDHWPEVSFEPLDHDMHLVLLVLQDLEGLFFTQLHSVHVLEQEQFLHVVAVLCTLLLHCHTPVSALPSLSTCFLAVAAVATVAPVGALLEVLHPTLDNGEEVIEQLVEEGYVGID